MKPNHNSGTIAFILFLYGLSVLLTAVNFLVSGVDIKVWQFMTTKLGVASFFVLFTTTVFHLWLTLQIMKNSNEKSNSNRYE